MRTSFWMRWGVAACLAAALAACSGGGSGGDSLSALGVDDGASNGVSKSVQATIADDTRITLKTGATLEVPAGALMKDTKITMERPADTKALDLVGRFKTSQDRIASAPYVLTPHGTKFKEPVTVTLPLAKGNSREVSVAWLEDENDTEWKVLGVAKTEGRTASIELKHFSVLVVVEDASDLTPVEDIESDAGTGVDAGGVAYDASASSDDAAMAPDTSTQPALDAGRGDAGSSARDDAGSTSEAGAIVDAGIAIPDGAVTVDAGPFTGDGGTFPVDAGTDGGLAFMPQYLKLMSCGFVTTPGAFSERFAGSYPYDNPYSLCLSRCANSGSCFDAQIYACNIDASPDLDIAQCFADCANKQAPAINCKANPQITAVRCDRSSDCPDGEDEQNCDPGLFFDCGNAELIPLYSRCNGIFDCTSESDEVGCFQCDQDAGSRVLPTWKVCDGQMDCADGTDEPANCAVIMCNPPV